MPAKEVKKASVYRLRWDLEELVLEESLPDGQFVERARPGIGVPPTPLAATHPDLKGLLIESLKKLRHGWLGQSHVLDVALSPPWAFGWLFEAVDLPEDDFIEYVEWELQQRVKSDLNDNIYAWQPVKDKVYAVVVRPELLAFWDDILRSLSINIGKITLRTGLVPEQIESGADLLSLYRVWKQQQGSDGRFRPGPQETDFAQVDSFDSPAFDESDSLLGDSGDSLYSGDEESLYDSGDEESLYGSGDETSLYEPAEPKSDDEEDFLSDALADLGVGKEATDELLDNQFDSMKNQRTDLLEEDDDDVSGFYDDIEPNGKAKRRDENDDDYYDEDDELGEYFKKKKPTPVLYVVIIFIIAFNLFLFRDKLPFLGGKGGDGDSKEEATAELTIPTSTGFVAQILDIAESTGNQIPGLILQGQHLRTEVLGDCTSVISFAQHLMSKPGSSDWVINAPVTGADVHLIDMNITNQGEKEITSSQFKGYIDSLGYQMIDDNIVRVDKIGLQNLLVKMASDSSRPFRLSVHEDGAGGYNLFMMP